MSELQSLIFDVDGTLADTERDGHRVAFNQAFDETGLDWHWSVDLYGELLKISGGKERIRFYIENYLANFHLIEPIQAFAAKLHQRKTHFYLTLLQQGKIPLRCGVKDLINDARAANLRLAIATTTTFENVTYLLKATLGEASIAWFEVIAAGDIVPAKKPAPDIYLYTLEKMNLSATHCLAFEDSHNGLMSAHQAKLTTIITTNVYTKNDDFSQAALVVDDLDNNKTTLKALYTIYDQNKKYH